ncbi:substrate-binding domain-containing protein [Granulicella sibirica]|uniref:Tungstate ABC transporter, periplasmic substrate-binding protein WtpA n=1 Tax=Granulicella sibirica TaxID=2479048 RepID=A0A4Q0SZZ0_9BACT|nr:substrate-binding domain-containing protein [Granulicella sibirica]RXH54676.1 Tungstate ABC transporter, periplasmic substrate-binding protein WtpA [Granulicella sibirica]
MVRNGTLAATALALPRHEGLFAQSLPGLEVASAGSIRAMLDGPLKDAATTDLRLDLHTHSGGADAIARSIVDGILSADIFIPITAEPMRTVMQSGRAQTAYPIARTEMVILYSAKSRFAPAFAAAAEGKRNWWEVLQEPGLNFARSNPNDDPSGRCILFTMMLAAKKYGQPDLLEKVLGAPLNPSQVRPGTSVRTGLENGTIDAAGSYKIATRLSNIPFLTLPADVNLSGPRIHENHPDLSLAFEKKTFYPESLVFYAAALTPSENAQGALRFLNWLRGKQAATLFERNGFGLPDSPAPLNRPA